MRVNTDERFPRMKKGDRLLSQDGQDRRRMDRYRNKVFRDGDQYVVRRKRKKHRV